MSPIDKQTQRFVNDFRAVSPRTVVGAAHLPFIYRKN